jgi:hypothetical protein
VCAHARVGGETQRLQRAYVHVREALKAKMIRPLARSWRSSVRELAVPFIENDTAILL